jgi:hypothetical protein
LAFLQGSQGIFDRDKDLRGSYKEPPRFARTSWSFFMRIFGIALLAASLFVTGALAEPLPAGHPAGVRDARSSTNTALMIGVGVVILAGVGILASGDSAAVSSLQITSQGITVPPANVVVTTTTSTSSTGTR